MSSLLKLAELKRYVRGLSRDSKLSIEFNEFVDEPQYKGNKLMFPEPGSGAGELELDRIRWLAGREASRHEHRHDFDSTSLHGALARTLHDSALERDIYQTYAGDRKAMDAAYPDVLKNFGSKAMQALMSGDSDATKFVAVAAAAQTAKHTWSSTIGDEAESMLTTLPEPVRELVDKLEGAGYFDKFASVETARDAGNLAIDVLKFLEDEEQEQESPGEGEGEGEDQSEGEGEDQSESGESEETDGEGGRSGAPSEGGDASESEGGKEAPRTEEQTVKWEDLIPGGAPTEESDTLSTAGMHIDWDGVQSDGVYCAEPIVINKPADYLKNPAKYLPGIEGCLSHADVNPRVLGNKLRRLLQVRSVGRWEGGKKHGRLAKRSLYRAASPTLGSGEWNQKIYRQKADAIKLDTAVYLLVDASGSMAGNKYNLASVSAGLLVDAISTALRVPVEVAAFTTNWHDSDEERTQYYEIKLFNEPVKFEGVLNRMGHIKQLANNEDGDAVLEAYRRLRARKEPRKLLIVLSDGGPAGYVGDSYGYLKDVVNQIYEAGDIEMYGIGIEDKNVEYFYKDAKSIKSADELEETVLNVIKTKFL